MKQKMLYGKKRAIIVGILFLIISISVVLFSLNTGTLKLSPLTVAKTFIGLGDFKSNTVLFDYRMPRILITILAGIGLGVSGVILQGISRNGLADPGIIGLHSGASFGLLIFITYFHTMLQQTSILIPLFTFLGGLLTAIIIIVLAYDRQRGLLSIRLILVGIAVSAGFSALTLFLALRLDEDTYTFASRWLVGNVWGKEWIHVIALLPWIAILAPYAWSQSRVLNALSLNDDTATSIGISVQKKRIALLLVAVALSSSSVAMVGGIGFIGLVSPHIARKLVGPLHQHFLPVAGLIGLIILVLADTIGRVIFPSSAIPAGIIVALIGAPYFLFLLTRTK